MWSDWRNISKKYTQLAILAMLRITAMPFTDKASRSYDASLSLHDDIAAITGVAACLLKKLRNRKTK